MLYDVCGRVMYEWCLSVRRKDRLQVSQGGSGVLPVTCEPKVRVLAASLFQLGASNVRHVRLDECS
jgi:hypothetical protein